LKTFARLFFSRNKKELSQEKKRQIILKPFINIIFLTQTIKRDILFYALNIKKKSLSF